MVPDAKVSVGKPIVRSLRCDEGASKGVKRKRSQGLCPKVSVNALRGSSQSSSHLRGRTMGDATHFRIRNNPSRLVPRSSGTTLETLVPHTFHNGPLPSKVNSVTRGIEVNSVQLLTHLGLVRLDPSA